MPQSDTWQVFERHARPVPQVVPPQQGWPAPPQAWQMVPKVEHWKPSVQALPAQQRWPGPPQAVHVPPLQVEPAAQVVPQHAWPGAPHAWQKPSRPQVREAPHDGVARWQQRCPAPPHD